MQRLRSKTLDTTNILVLGFYDRANAGDEMYKTAFAYIFRNDPYVRLTFKCTDDIEKIPCDTHIVICGGGDIINDYFMTKIQKLLKSFYGPIYAVSVGIPFSNGIKYLDIFDHVFIRNKQDFRLAKDYLGEKNVTYLPDIGFILNTINTPKNLKLKHKSISNEINLGICLAQPVFVNNPSLFKSMTDILIEILVKYTNINIYFYSFNTYTSNFKECDLFCAEKLVSMIPPVLQLRCKVKDEFLDPLTLFYDMKSMNFIIAMRYHSVVFSLVQNIPFIALYKSKKVDTLLEDFGLSKTNQKIDSDINVTEFIKLFDEQYTNSTNQLARQTPWYFECIRENILRRKLQRFLIRHPMITFEQSLFTTMKALSLHLNMDKNMFDKVLYARTLLDLKDKDPLHVARLICYTLTGNISHPCIWGLKDNIVKPDFDLFEALKYIYTYSNDSKLPPRVRVYYPTIKMNRTCLLDIDPFFSNDFRGLHRSGWSYIVDHLMNLDAKHIGRQGKLLVDTYIDRTFHWGMETMKAIDILPYNKPWIGFIHHTFDTTHSDHNCVKLFTNDMFLESLNNCYGLIVLSNYLASRVRDELSKREIDVKVHVLLHPTEFVTNTFTMSKFMNNKFKKIVNIGAWLRNPYSIFQLQLCASKNPLGIHKAILKGKEMEGYFKPTSLFNELHTVLIDNTTSNCVATNPCRDTANNKYCIGMYNFLVERDHSVLVLENLSNDDYDKLLSENIVFLDLVDCSAVNTVVECIVRNTPIIVNRHPALEEVLGTNYPGFYSHLDDVIYMFKDDTAINNIHKHLKKLNKCAFNINDFMLKFKAIIESITVI